MFSKDSLLPFPWGEKNASPCGQKRRHDYSESLGERSHSKLKIADTSVDPPGNAKRLSSSSSSDHLLAYKTHIPTFTDLLDECKGLGCISFQLPPVKAVAGVVLAHAISKMMGLFSKHSPMIFKIGFTHNPAWRWSNSIYGYASSRDRWSDMVVLYLATEPYSTAMLEAALIEKFNSHLAAIQVKFWDHCIFNSLKLCKQF